MQNEIREPIILKYNLGLSTETPYLQVFSYLNENRETVAGQGWATKMSLRAHVESRFEFIDTDILDTVEGTI